MKYLLILCTRLPWRCRSWDEIPLARRWDWSLTDIYQCRPPIISSDVTPKSPITNNLFSSVRVTQSLCNFWALITLRMETCQIKCDYCFIPSSLQTWPEVRMAKNHIQTSWSGKILYNQTFPDVIISLFFQTLVRSDKGWARSNPPALQSSFKGINQV